MILWNNTTKLEDGELMGTDELLIGRPNGVGGYTFCTISVLNATEINITELIEDEDIKTHMLENGAVTTPKIADLSVTTQKVDNGAIIWSKLSPAVQSRIDGLFTTTEGAALSDRVFTSETNIGSIQDITGNLGELAFMNLEQVGTVDIEQLLQEITSLKERVLELEDKDETIVFDEENEFHVTEQLLDLALKEGKLEIDSGKTEGTFTSTPRDLGAFENFRLTASAENLFPSKDIVIKYYVSSDDFSTSVEVSPGQLIVFAEHEELDENEVWFKALLSRDTTEDVSPLLERITITLINK